MQEKITTNHQEIKDWAEKYGGKPQLIDDPHAASDAVGIRIDFPGSDGEQYLPAGEVRNIGWDEFFRYFERLKLAFSYTEPSDTDGETLSNAYFFIKRQALDDKVNDAIEQKIETKETELNDFLKREDE